MLLASTLLTRVALVAVGAAAGAATVLWLRRAGWAWPRERLLWVGVLAAMQLPYSVFAALDPGSSSWLVEAALAATFGVLALIGWRLEGRLLLLGYFAHGLWDLRHVFASETYTPSAYPELCVGYDWLIFVHLAARLLRSEATTR